MRALLRRFVFRQSERLRKRTRANRSDVRRGDGGGGGREDLLFLFHSFSLMAARGWTIEGEDPRDVSRAVNPFAAVAKMFIFSVLVFSCGHGKKSEVNDECDLINFFFMLILKFTSTFGKCNENHRSLLTCSISVLSYAYICKYRHTLF